MSGEDGGAPAGGGWAAPTRPYPATGPAGAPAPSGPGHPGAAVAFPAAWRAPTPRPKRPARARIALLAGSALSLVAAMILGGLAWSQFNAGRAPAAVVDRYFTALSNGDAPAALALADSAPDGASVSYLTSTVLDEQLRIAPITDISVTPVSDDADSARVAVSYRLGFAGAPQAVSDMVTLAKRGGSWRLSRVAGSVSVSDPAAGADRLTFAGRPLPTDPVTLFPGALPLGTDTSAVLIDGQPSVRLADSDSAVSVHPDLTTAAKAQIVNALGTALERCLAPTSTDPRCPMISGGRPVPGSLHGTLTRKIADSTPTIALSAKGAGLIDVSVQASVEATWKVWDFNNQQQPRSESTTVAVTAVSSVSAPQTIDWVPSNG